MRLILQLADLTYYEYKGEIVWFKNLNKGKPVKKGLKNRLQSLRDRGEL